VYGVFLAPYLINVKKLPYDKASEIIKQWLNESAKLKRLDFYPD
jgi:hypothetical protein